MYSSAHVEQRLHCNCGPTAIAAVSLALSAVGSISSYVSGKNQAKEENDATKAFYEANKTAAITSADINMAEIGLRQSEEILSSNTQKYDVGQNVQALKSSATVAAAEGNVSGNSVDAILNDINHQGSTEKARIDTNTRLTINQLQRAKQGEIVQAQNNINTVRPSNIRPPSIITPLIQVAGAGVSSLDYLQQHKAKKPGNI